MITNKEVEEFIALMQRRQLRKAWVGDWEPDYNKVVGKTLIVVYKNTVAIEQFNYYSSPLSFPTKEMAQEFLDCFKELIEKAKILL